MVLLFYLGNAPLDQTNIRFINGRFLPFLQGKQSLHFEDIPMKVRGNYNANVYFVSVFCHFCEIMGRPEGPPWLFIEYNLPSFSRQRPASHACAPRSRLHSPHGLCPGRISRGCSCPEVRSQGPTRKMLFPAY